MPLFYAVTDEILSYRNDYSSMRDLLRTLYPFMTISIIFCRQLKGDPPVLVCQNFDFACEEFIEWNRL